MDHWRTIERYESNPAASGVKITEATADEFAAMRFAELLKLGDAQAVIDAALRNWRGNHGCAALAELAPCLVAWSKAQPA